MDLSEFSKGVLNAWGASGRCKGRAPPLGGRAGWHAEPGPADRHPLAPDFTPGSNRTLMSRILLRRSYWYKKLTLSYEVRGEEMKGNYILKKARVRKSTTAELFQITACCQTSRGAISVKQDCLSHELLRLPHFDFLA